MTETNLTFVGKKLQDIIVEQSVARSRFDRLEIRFGKIEERMDLFEAKFDIFEIQLNAIDTKIDKLAEMLKK
jgi:hypothetical protein